MGISRDGSRIVLGVDLDEVVFAYADGLREWLREVGHTVPAGPPSSWSLAEAGWFADHEEYLRAHGAAVEDGLYAGLQALPGASETLWELYGAGYRINIITSRFVLPGQHQKVAAQTVAALDSASIPYSNISFLADKTSQLADAYIDDSPSNIRTLTAAGRTVLAFDTPYNRGVRSSYRVRDWGEVRSVLRSEFGL